jgi:hypothetical protein
MIVLVLESQGRILNAAGVNELSSEGNGGSAKREED